MMRYFLFIFILLSIARPSFSSSAPNIQMDVDANISDALIRGNLLDIKEKLTSFLAKQKLDTRVEIERVGNSQYLFVSTRNDAYLTDEDTEYLIPVRGRDVYQVGNHFSRYNLSNAAHNRLLELQQLWFIYQDALPLYGATSSKNKGGRIYAFVDLTCAYCKNFHLSKMEKYRERGFSFIYIPFLRDPRNKNAAQLSVNTFCGPAETLKERVSSAYQEKTPPLVMDVDYSMCSPDMAALLKYTFNIGAELGFIGSPLFHTEKGQLAFGEPALSKIVKL
tara:strand:+ start:74151 stop:74984 length:834 start_codon:yes stop_codon:yes gene_type:complete